jgi:hypothetical protein
LLLPERSRAIVEKRPLLSVGNPLASAREQAELVAENGLPCLVMVGDLPLLFESFEIAGQLLRIRPSLNAGSRMRARGFNFMRRINRRLHYRRHHFTLVLGIPDVPEYPKVGGVCRRATTNESASGNEPLELDGSPVREGNPRLPQLLHNSDIVSANGGDIDSDKLSLQSVKIVNGKRRLS